jgi:hypothetical protein
MSGAEGGAELRHLPILACYKFSIIYLMRIRDMGQESPAIVYPLAQAREISSGNTEKRGVSSPGRHG